MLTGKNANFHKVVGQNVISYSGFISYTLYFTDSICFGTSTTPSSSSSLSKILFAPHAQLQTPKQVTVTKPLPLPISLSFSLYDKSFDKPPSITSLLRSSPFFLQLIFATEISFRCPRRIALGCAAELNQSVCRSFRRAFRSILLHDSVPSLEYS